MIRLVPLAIMLTGLVVIWPLNPPWRWMIAGTVIACLIAYRIFVNPKYYK